MLDVKRGSGAFLPDLERGLELATLMVSLGGDYGLPVVALLTAMDRPLGRACGNALEVEEAIQLLLGDGPPDLLEVTYALGAEMLQLGGVAEGTDAARRMMEVAISSGSAARKIPRHRRGAGGRPARGGRSVAAATGRRVRVLYGATIGRRGHCGAARRGSRHHRVRRWAHEDGRRYRPERRFRDFGASRRLRACR